MFQKELGVIGVGKIGNALISRFISTQTIENDKIIVYDIDSHRLYEKSKELNVESAENNISLVRSAKYILIAVIPQVIDKVLNEISPAITNQHTIVSIVAGVTINHIENFINNSPLF